MFYLMLVMLCVVIVFVLILIDYYVVDGRDIKYVIRFVEFVEYEG